MLEELRKEYRLAVKHLQRLNDYWETCEIDWLDELERSIERTERRIIRLKDQLD